MVVALEGVGSSLEGIPNLLAALEGRGCVPELIPLTAELPVRHGVIALPFGLLFLQRLVTTESHCEGRKGKGEFIKRTAQNRFWVISFRIYRAEFTPRQSLSLLFIAARAMQREGYYLHNAHSNFHLLREL